MLEEPTADNGTPLQNQDGSISFEQRVYNIVKELSNPETTKDQLIMVQNHCTTSWKTLALQVGTARIIMVTSLQTGQFTTYWRNHFPDDPKGANRNPKCTNEPMYNFWQRPLF